MGNPGGPPPYLYRELNLGPPGWLLYLSLLITAIGCVVVLRALRGKTYAYRSGKFAAMILGFGVVGLLFIKCWPFKNGDAVPYLLLLDSVILGLGILSAESRYDFLPVLPSAWMTIASIALSAAVAAIGVLLCLVEPLANKLRFENLPLEFAVLAFFGALVARVIGIRIMFGRYPPPVPPGLWTAPGREPMKP